MKKKWKSGVSLFMATALVVGNISIAEPIKAEAAGANTYYIDAVNGSDSNSGTSEEQAWESFANLKDLKLTAGEKVLLKAGCTWNDEKLEITGAEGTAEQPVILGRYGEGEDPLINGNGSNWLDELDRSKLNKEDVAAVHVKNSKYITIQNLEVTNREEDSADLMGEVSKKEYDQSKYMLTGILVENRDAGDLPGVVIKDNYVHDVNGYMSTNGTEGHKKGSGGIMALVTGGETKSRYTDLKITGNRVENVCHEAIYMESCWAARTLVGGANSQQAGKLEWVGWPNVYVAHNYVNDVAGDGIVLINADGGIAEYNLVTASASEDWNYKRNPAHAAIWMWDCNNVTMQYNEAAYTTSTQDGMAFDCDYGNQNVMYQYNYSHDNKGGFWMACPGPYYTVNSVIRYNVSVNDGLFDGTRIIRVGEKGSIGHQFYNNTMYWEPGYEVNAVEQGSWGTPPTSGTDIYNNIFYGDTAEIVNNEGIHYDSNCVWGSAKDVYPLDEDINAIVADPSFVDVEDYTDGEFTDATPETEGKVTLGAPNGFKLNQNSPCINAGRDYMPVPEESLEKVASELVSTQITLENKDYEGNAVPFKTGNAATERVDIGAFEYQGEGTYKPTGTADKTYLKALVDMTAEYKEADFTAETWAKFKTASDNAKKVLERATATQKSVDATAVAMEKALSNLEKAGAVRPGTAADDILAGYNSSDTIDNSGFEKSSSGWGTWQSTVAISTDKAHTGSQSLKVTQTSSGSTAYSELGGIPVAANTTYVLEAWVHSGDDDFTKLGLEAKHHNSVTDGKGDIKLKNMTLAADAVADENGWHKAVMEFTTKEYEKISVSISSDIATVYVDDVIVYPKTIKENVGEALDKTGIEEALALTPQYKESYYSEKSWKAYQDAMLAARLEYVNPFTTQTALNKTSADLNKAFQSLTKKTDKRVLESTYNLCKLKSKGSYTDASWNAFQNAITAAKRVLDNENATQAETDTALKNLKNARDALTLVAPTPAKRPYKNALQSMYNTWNAKKKGDYTDTSWKKLRSAITAAKKVLDNKNATQAQIDKALEDLENARDGLAKKKAQAIKYTKTFTKAFGDKAFSLGAKRTTGNGALSYKTSNKKVATVAKNGKVTIKGIGQCTITITAKVTDTYKAKSVKVTLTVNPKKAALSKLSLVKGKKLKVTWKKDSKATGYEVQCALKKDFKKIAKKATIKKAGTTSTTLTKLTKGKKYYVRVRAYKNVKISGKTKKLVGAWSTVKLSGKIKK